MTKAHVVLLVTLLLTIGFLAGCTQTTAPTPAQELQTILAKIKTTPSIHYSVTSIDDYNITTNATVWEKKPYLKMTQQVDHNQTTILVRPEANYLYNANNKTWTTLNIKFGSFFLSNFTNQLSPMLNTSTITTGILNGLPVHIITSILNGPPVHIITNHTETTTRQIWIWDDHGVPLKSQVTINDSTYSLQLYSNYSFADIPDSVFSTNITR